MLRKSTFNINNRQGYGLLGIMITLAISSLLITGIMMTIDHIYGISADRTNHIMAVREVQNAGRWFTLDARKAGIIDPAADDDGFPLTISWDDIDDNQYEVVYTLTSDNTVLRKHYTNKIVNPDPDATTLVASYIDPFNTSCNISKTNELIANITATVNIGGAAYTKTRIYRIFPRENLH